MSYILGINCYHADSSACLLLNGQLIIALEEERINRIKHWAGFPKLSIIKCLESASINIGDIDCVAINQNFKANLFRKIMYGVFNLNNFNFFLDKIKIKMNRSNILKTIEDEIGKLKKNCKLIEVEHHLSHMSSAYYDSKYNKAVNLSVDGFGDFASVAWGSGIGSDIKIDNKIMFPHSLGIFYEAFTQFLGFNNYGDEYKLMGLSAYGKPTELKKLSNIITLIGNGEFKLNLEYFMHHQNKSHYSWSNSLPITNTLFNKKIQNLFGPSRKAQEQLGDYHYNIAASVQKFYEDTLFYILDFLYKKYRIDNLTLSGGCAQNSLANGKILKNSKFSSLFIPANPGDGGGAVGAANIAWKKISNLPPKRNLTAYLGLNFKDEDIKLLIDKNKLFLNNKDFAVELVKNEDLLCLNIAKSISMQKVVGWFQGKMEWGPRALGNRSIISDPRNKDIKNTLNDKIKRRESFRPFAPSILSGYENEWFCDFIEEDKFMSRVLKFKENKKNLIPGVVHVDGTGRLQTVTANDNPRYYKLIKNFYDITGVPILLNTSFNENEPIVSNPIEALDCFLRTKMDVLVLENYIISRK